MKVIHGINNIGKIQNPVVALGVFDGLHRGHINILKAAVRKARRIKGRSVVITFWPHPQGEESIYSLEHRLRLIASLGVDFSLVINFSRSFSCIRAEEFVRKILLEKISCRYLFVGENFRFGSHAEGDLNLLERYSRIYGFKLKAFKVIKFHRQPISSTSIRRLIKKGDLPLAERLLSRPVSVLGTVIRGASLARRLGFPTANIDPHHEVIPPPGIYAVRINYRNRNLTGICYIGNRPTFSNRDKGIHIEVHIFNFKRNIYAEYLDIQFVRKIREDRRFKSSSLLARQIKKDIVSAKGILSLP